MKVIGIIENSPITGVKYGLVEIPETVISEKKRVADAHKSMAQVRVKHAGMVRNLRGKHK